MWEPRHFPEVTTPEAVTSWVLTSISDRKGRHVTEVLFVEGRRACHALCVGLHRHRPGEPHWKPHWPRRCGQSTLPALLHLLPWCTRRWHRGKRPLSRSQAPGFHIGYLQMPI